MSTKEPELIVNTVVDPAKWDKAIAFLQVCHSIADFAHDCDHDPYCEDCALLDEAYDFLKEVE